MFRSSTTVLPICCFTGTARTGVYPSCHTLSLHDALPICWLARQRGGEVIEIVHQHPASFESLVGTYREAFIRYPRLKLMALTYVNHLTGLVIDRKSTRLNSSH